MNYIIGNGITGLIWNYYFPDWTIIAPVSSKSGETYTRTHLVWLHDCIETRKLLTDLGLPIKTKRSMIGYFYGGWVFNNLTPDLNLVLIQKKMTEWNKVLDSNFVPKTKDLSLSTVGSTSYMNTLDVDLTEMINRLSQRAKIQNGFVSKIDDETITIKENFDPTSTEKVEKYDKLVSTMAAPLFWKTYGKEKEFKCMPITNIVTNVKPSLYDNRFEMIYYSDEVPFSRISYLNNQYCLEFTGIITKEEFQEKYPDLPIIDYFIVKQGRIFDTGENSPPVDKIIFSGRFSTWKYGVSTEHVIAQVLEYKEHENRDSIRNI